MHAESLPVTGHQAADMAISPDAQGRAIQQVSNTEVGWHGCCLQPGLLPGAMLEVADVLRQASHGSHDQGPGQLGGSPGGARAFRDCDAAFRACLHIDIAAHPAGLHDKLEPWQLLDERAGEVGAFTDQDDDVGILEPNRQLADPLDRVGIDLRRVRFQFAGTCQFAYCILVVVENHDVHGAIVPCAQACLARRQPPCLRSVLPRQVPVQGRIAPFCPTS